MTADPKPVRPRRRRLARLFAILVAVALGAPAGFLLANLIRVPWVETLQTYQPGVITLLYDRKGREFADYAIQRRIVIPKKDMAPALIQAILSTEDSNFYRHGGLDPKAILRAAIKDLIARKKVEGASTLTQQLAKQVFLTPEKSWRRKINEAFFAVEIEKRFTKDQIIEMYANQVYLGHVAYGVEAAARFYFGKHAKDLTLPEAAQIAGMIRRPMAYSPITRPESALKRRNHVLFRMLQEKYLTQQQYRQAVATPIVLGAYHDDDPEVGAYFAEEVRQHLEKTFGTEHLYRSGLAVWTTLDLDIQTAAEQSLEQGLRNFDHRRGLRKPTRNLVREGAKPEEFEDPAWGKTLRPGLLYPASVLEVGKDEVVIWIAGEKVTLDREGWAWTKKKSLRESLETGDIVHVRFELDPKSKSEKRIWSLEQLPQVQGALVAIEVKSGEVVAMVGGYDFGTSKFNRAVQSLRQTGSAFKPFVYGAALERGFTPAETLFDAPISVRVGTKLYSPRNYKGEYSGIVTIQRALELSINIPAVKTYMMVGGENVVDFTKRCGVSSQLDQYPSLALGAAGVSPIEMTAAYGVFANQGVYIKPRLIRKITDSTRKVLEESYPELTEATSPQVAYQLAYMLQGTIDRGTAYKAHDIPGALAGKTGTTNGYTDAWFMGFSPEYVIGVWIGYDDPSRTLGNGSTGADVALPIWIDVMKKIQENALPAAPTAEFEPPPGIVVVPMDLRTGRRGHGPCTRVVKAAFVAGQEPSQDCSGASVAVANLPFDLQRPFYHPKDLEPSQIVIDPSARPGEGSESPTPPLQREEPSSP